MSEATPQPQPAPPAAPEQAGKAADPVAPKSAAGRRVLARQLTPRQVQALTIGGLAAVVVVLLVAAAAGWWWALAVAVLLALAAGWVALLWRIKRWPGLRLPGLGSGRSGGGGSPRSGSGRGSGGSPGLGRARTPAAGGGRRSPLGRLLGGGGRPGAGKAAGGAGRPGGGGRRLWPFGGRGKTSSPAGGRPGTGAGRSPGGGRMPGFGRARSGQPGGGGGRRPGGLAALWPRTRKSSPSGTTGSSGAGRKRKGKRPGILDELRAGVDWATKAFSPSPKAKAADAKPAPEKPTAAPTPTATDQGHKPSPEPPTKQAQPDTQPAPEPRQPGNNTRRFTVIKHDADSSLFAWARNLRTVSPALEELAREEQRNESRLEVAASALSKLTTQGETDQVADRRLVADLESISKELQDLKESGYSARLRNLAARAETLWSQYQDLHEADEGRLAGERGGRDREKRADVSAGEMDT